MPQNMPRSKARTDVGVLGGEFSVDAVGDVETSPTSCRRHRAAWNTPPARATPPPRPASSVATPRPGRRSPRANSRRRTRAPPRPRPRRRAVRASSRRRDAGGAAPEVRSAGRGPSPRDVRPRGCRPWPDARRRAGAAGPPGRVRPRPYARDERARRYGASRRPRPPRRPRAAGRRRARAGRSRAASVAEDVAETVETRRLVVGKCGHGCTLPHSAALANASGRLAGRGPVNVWRDSALRTPAGAEDTQRCARQRAAPGLSIPPRKGPP